MTQNRYANKTHGGGSKPVSLLLIVAATLATTSLSGCASGPTPEEIALAQERAAERERERREAEALRQQQEEERRAEAARRQAVQQGLQTALTENTPGRSLDAESLARAAAALDTLNAAAAESLQTDVGAFLIESPVKENPETLFTLDPATGRLELWLTPEMSRSILLRQVEEVRTNVNTMSMTIMNNPTVTSQSFEVIVDMGDDYRDLVRVSDNGSESWKNFYRVMAASQESADVIESSLLELVALYAD